MITIYENKKTNSSCIISGNFKMDRAELKILKRLIESDRSYMKNNDFKYYCIFEYKLMSQAIEDYYKKRKWFKMKKLISCLLMSIFALMLTICQPSIYAKADTIGLQTNTGIVSGKITYQDNIPDKVPLDQLLSMSIDVNNTTNPELFTYNPGFNIWALDAAKMNLTGNIYHYRNITSIVGIQETNDYFVKVLSVHTGDTSVWEVVKIYSVVQYVNGSYSNANRNSNISCFNQTYFQYLLNENNSTPTPTPTPQVKQYNSKRLAGKGRIDTSLAIATEYNNSTLQNVILATAYNFPDALSGSVLAKKLNAPILLVGTSSIENSNVLSFIKNHLDTNGNIYILGGTGVISDSVISSIKSFGFKNFIRLGGADRIETDLKIESSLGISSGTPVVIATQNDFPDALSISAVAASKGFPILLSDKDSIDQRTVNVINSIKPSQIFIIGGTGVIGSNVENQLKAYSSNVIRISGTNRFATSLAVCNYFNLVTNSAVIATGYDFPDALSGSSLAAKFNAPILLIDSADTVKQKQLIDTTNISNLYILGGTGVVSDSAVSNLTK